MKDDRVYPELVARRKGKLLIVRCEYCKRNHTHGGPTGTHDDFGHRAAHCPSDSGSPYCDTGYMLVPEPN